MAALRLYCGRLTNFNKFLVNSTKCYSTKTATGNFGLVDKVALSDDGTTFVAWHPNVDFPYEFSRPLPPAKEPTSSLIRDEAVATAMRAFGEKHPQMAVDELARTTFTCKHKWYPRSRDRRAKKTSMDREYL